MDNCKFKGATSGPYPHRAELISRALDDEIAKALPDVSFKSRDSGDKLELTWSLPERVSIRIEKSSGADPQIVVARPDVRGDNLPDFRHWFQTRSPFDGSYDLVDVINHARQAVEYNRQKREEYEAIEQAISKELKGLEIPSGAALVREPKTGLYKLTVPLEFSSLKVEDLKRIVGTLNDLKVTVGKLPG